MVNPESPVGRLENLKRALAEILKKIAGERNRRELAEAITKQEEKKKEETMEKRKAQAERKAREEAERKAAELDERRSTERRIEEKDIARARENIQRDTINEAKNELKQALKQPETPEERQELSGYEGSRYIFDSYIDDPGKITSLNELMEVNPKVAEAMLELAKKDATVHQDPGELLKLGRIMYLNTTEAEREVLEPIFREISKRIKDLFNVELTMAKENVRRHEGKWDENEVKRNIISGIINETAPYIAPEVRQRFLNEGESAVDNVLRSEFERTGEITVIEEKPIKAKTLAIGAIRDIDNIWEEVENAERAGISLSVDKLEKMRRDIYKAESNWFPQDVFPNSTDYLNSVNAVRNYSEGRLNALAERLKQKLEREGPQFKRLKSTEEFIHSMVENPGYLGRLLNQNPEMLKLFTGSGPESYRFRNKIFLQIHNSVLSQRRESSNDNFGLYERSDFTAFTSILRSRMKDIKVPTTGESVGQTWVDYYTGLSNTIRHSRDIDFWTSQPGATMEQLQRSMIMFQNEYTVQAMSIPAVEQAFRAYETALTTIRDANDGYIPPGLIDYDPVNMTSFWDVSAQNLLTKFIKQGVVKDAKREYKRMGGMPEVSSDGVSVELGDTFSGVGDKATEVDPLELKMYMTLAKGFGMVSMRMPEIISNAKIPGVMYPTGVVHPESGVPGFRSPAFEGIITALNHWNVFIKKWRQFTYKYFCMMNTVLPQDERLPVGAGAAERVYRHLQEGTFKSKYGDKALTMIDTLNYTRTHGALGPTTPWRTMDNTIGWTDKQRELLGGPTRILLAGRLCGEMLKSAVVEQKYKEEFRQVKRAQGQAAVGSDFEALWQSEGMSVYGERIEKEWEEYQHHHKGEVKQLTENLQRVYKARMWVETAMRNPLAIAHNVDVEIPIAGYSGKTKKRKLHNYIVEQVLGIQPEDLETGTVVDGETLYRVNAAKYESPTLKQRQLISDVLDLEGDMAAVREVALEENRELTEEDFDRVIKDPKRSEHAKKYWKIVKKFITGEDDPDYKGLYEKLGIKYHVDPNTKKEMEYYSIDWEKIEDAGDKIFKDLQKNKIVLPEKLGGEINIGIPKAFDKDFLERDWHWYFSTEDTAFRKMAFLNLGNRQWVRRGGDVSAHFAGGMEVDEYLDRSLLPNPDVDELAKQLVKIRKGYQGDAAEVGFRIAGHLAYLTGKLYEFDYKRLGSTAQLDVWKTRRNVAAWTANGRRKFWDAIEHQDVIPPHAHFEHWSGPELSDVHKLRDLNHANNSDVWTEILLLGVALATAMTIWRALTAKSEEAEGGGGGH